MASTGFKVPRAHNRRFPGKLGKRPDFSKERRLGALARHYVNRDRLKANGVDHSHIDRCIEGTRKNLGMDL